MIFLRGELFLNSIFLFILVFTVWPHIEDNVNMVV